MVLVARVDRSGCRLEIRREECVASLCQPLLKSVFLGMGALSLLYSAQLEHTKLNPDSLNLGVQHKDVASK